MTIYVSRTIMRMTSLMVSVGLLGGLSACATTSVSKIEEAAPVTYRIGEGSSSYASIRTPERAPSAAMNLPQTAPSISPLATPRPAPQPAPQQLASAAEIDLSGIDRGLYDHMKVGKPYKVAGQTYQPQHNPDYDKIGVASWYGDKFHGKPTANGEVYDKNALTAAHKTLPLNSYVYVTNLDNGQSIKVRLNDRGPFIEGRVIDLSEAAAAHLGIRQSGTGRVRVQYAGAALASSGQSYQQTVPTQSTERAPQQVAPTPQPVPQPVTLPSPVAETPEVQSVPYAPLRNGGSTQPQQVAQQQPSPVFEVPSIMGSSGSDYGIAMPQRSAGQQQLPIPMPVPENTDEGVVTLTIKGPVHMAKSNNNNQGEPEVIPASYEEEK